MIGPSGAGKSTLVRLIAGFERPDAGTISMDGRSPTGPSKDRLVTFQESALFPWMTTRDNVTFGPGAEVARALLNDRPS
jgi:NitT/TauT family transport system ATP-binding protein